MLQPVATAALVITSVVVHAQPAPDWQAHVDRHARPVVDSGLVPSLSIALHKGDRTEFFAVGTLTPEGNERPTPDTLYEIGSITKVFTAILLAEADRRGEVRFDDPLSAHVPQGVTVPTRDETSIAMRMLAMHTSGLPRLPANMGFTDPDNPYADYDEAMLWKGLSESTLATTPGTTYAYSNFATGLLGTVLARAADTTYEQLLTDRITEPLGMTSTTITLPGNAPLAPPYASGNRPNHNWDLASLQGAGAIRSTARDMMAFARRVLDPQDQPLDAAIAETLTRQGDVPGAAYTHATGWNIAGDGSTLFHGGQTGGYHASLFISPPLDIAVVVLSNGADGIVSSAAEKLVQTLAGATVPPPETPRNTGVEAAHLDRLVGTYVNPLGITFHITRTGDALYARVEGQPALRVWPESKTEFVYREVPARLVFELPEAENDTTRPAPALTLFQNGREFRCVRR
jgi:D-alanyl-D-alanine-carboxypeptidase/D-alanyl-D-alanine-endopeptidase